MGFKYPKFPEDFILLKGFRKAVVDNELPDNKYKPHFIVT